MFSLQFLSLRTVTGQRSGDSNAIGIGINIISYVLVFIRKRIAVDYQNEERGLEN